MNRVIITIIGLLLLSQGAWGASIVAKPDAANPTTAVMYKTGTLANCSDTDASFATTNSKLSNASAAAGASGTLSLCAGTYKGTMLSAANGVFVLYYANQFINGEGTGFTFLDGSNSTSYIIDTFASGTSVSNLTVQNSPAAGYGFSGRSFDANLKDIVFQNNAVPFYFSGTTTKSMARVVIRNNTAKYYGGGGLLGGTLNCNYCLWENNSSQLRIEGTASVANISNSLMIGNRLGAITINTSGAVANLSNSIAIANVTDNSGTHPFAVVSGAALNVSNSIILPNGTRPETNFYTSATESNDLYTQPGFVSPRRFGWLSLYRDDVSNWPATKKTMDYANCKSTTGSCSTNTTGIGMVFCAEDTDPYNASNNPNAINAQIYSEMADYITKGNEIAAHVRYAHSDLTNMKAIDFKTTAVSPHLDVAIQQSDNSSANWSGTITIGDSGGADTVIAVTNTTTLADVVGAITARAGWSSTARNTAAAASSKAITLAAVTNMTTFPFTSVYDQNKFWYYEIAEHKKTLESGIGGGYVVKTFCYPGNSNNATLQEWIANDANFANAGTTAFTIARGNVNIAKPGSYNLNDDTVDSFNTGKGLQIMQTFTMDSPSLAAHNTRNIAALSALLTHVGGYATFHAHGDGEYSQAQWQTLIDTVLATPGMSIVLPRDAATTIRTSGLWSDTSNTSCTAAQTPYSCCSGNGIGSCSGLMWARHFTDAQDYHLQSGSPAINAGRNSVWSGMANVTDYAGTLITDSSGLVIAPGGAVDIGIYEDISQPSGSIIVNNGDVYTGSPSVQLALSASDPNSISGMCLSNTTDCTAWETFVTSKAWTLLNGNGTNTVYAWFRDGTGTINQVPFTASIVYDTTPLSAVAPSSPVNQPSYTLTGSMQSGSTMTITSGNGAVIGPVIYTSPNTWSCAVSSLSPGDSVFTITATTPFGQIASTTVTVNYAPGSITAVPAMSAPVVVALAAALMLVLRYANGRGTRKTGEC